MNKLIYIVAGVITFLLVILIMAPATLLMSIAGDKLKQIPDLEIGQVDGRIWAGSAQVEYRQLPAMVTWDLSALPLLLGRVSADIDLQEDGLNASFHVDTSTTEITVSDAAIQVDAFYINQVTMDYGLDLTGQFSVTGGKLSFENQWVTSASGNLNWPGGIVHIQTPQQLHSAVLPALSGDVSLSGENLHLTIERESDRMIDLTLKSNGWAEAAVSVAFMELAGLPLPGNSDSRPEEPALLLEEKIL